MKAKVPRCTLAVIGAGYTAREHTRAFSDVAGVKVAAIHSRTRARAEAVAAEFGIEMVCDSIAELHDRSRADLVVVTVPELAMNSVAKQSFEFPWTVMLEKPPGHHLDDALDIQRTADRHGRRVLVALNRRFLAATAHARAELESISGCRFIKVLDQQNQQAALADGQPIEVVKNYMYANSIHTIDYLRVFGRGEVTSVDPILPWTAGSPGVVVCRVNFASGDIGIYEGVWNAPGPWAVTVSVAGKRWEMRPLERLTTQDLGGAPRQADTSLWDTTFKPGFRMQAEAAVAASLGHPREAVSLGDAIETMRLISRIYT